MKCINNQNHKLFGLLQLIFWLRLVDFGFQHRKGFSKWSGGLDRSFQYQLNAEFGPNWLMKTLCCDYNRNEINHTRKGSCIIITCWWNRIWEWKCVMEFGHRQNLSGFPSHCATFDRQLRVHKIFLRGRGHVPLAFSVDLSRGLVINYPNESNEMGMGRVGKAI